MGAVFSARPLLGRVEKFLSPSCWVVQDKHRYSGALLLRPMLALEDHTIVALSLSPLTYKVFAKLGMRPLETEQLVLPPVPRPAEAARALRGSFTVDPAEIRAELTGDERKFCEDMAASPVARHALLRRGGRHCYIVATPSRKWVCRTPTYSTSASASSSGSIASSRTRRSPAPWASRASPSRSTAASSSDGRRRSRGA